MELTEAYRKARRNIAALSAVGIGWSTAQFQLNSLSIVGVGTIDTSNASVSVVISLGIVYLMSRCTLDFAMQPVDVRRWDLAQIDFKLTIRIAQVSFLLLAGGSLYRSVETIAYVVVGAIVLLVASFLAFIILFFVLAPIMLRIRRSQRRYGVVSTLVEAEGWAWLAVVALNISLFVALGYAVLNYGPVVTLWPTPPSAPAIGIFVIIASGVILSIYAERLWLRELFAYQPPYTEERLPDGRIGSSFSNKTREE